ncbi:MAG TPA: hypothetical protein PLC22_20825, partial [Gordonia sp. (in: high G+C Gram-positive bacteria)]|nr:hypothetical protein [Gordonia sp. (in: high G+C Gram-positive bacteria)]
RSERQDRIENLLAVGRLPPVRGLTVGLRRLLSPAMDTPAMNTRALLARRLLSPGRLPSRRLPVTRILLPVRLTGGTGLLPVATTWLIRHGL